MKIPSTFQLLYIYVYIFNVHIRLTNKSFIEGSREAYGKVFNKLR